MVVSNMIHPKFNNLAASNNPRDVNNLGSVSNKPRINSNGNNNTNNMNRLVMTAPKPRLQRLASMNDPFQCFNDAFNDAASTSSESSLDELAGVGAEAGGITTSATIRRNLFSPPKPLLSAKDQENVLPASSSCASSSSSSEAQQVMYSARGALMKTCPTPSSPSSKINGMRKGLRGRTPMKTPKRSSNTECGLTFEIKRELLSENKNRNRYPLGNGASNANNGGVGVSAHGSEAGSGGTFKTPSKAPRNNNNIMATPTTNKTIQFDNLLPRVPQTDTKLFLSKSSSFSSDEGNDSKSSKRSSATATTTSSNAKPTTSSKEESTSSSSSTSIYAFGTPIRKGRKKNPSLTFSALSSKKKLKKALTPPREGLGSHMKERTEAPSTSTSNSSTRHSMSLATSFLEVQDYRLTSSELDPSAFQLELPSKREMTTHGNICAMIDGYTALSRNFNFAMLAGVSRSTLEKEYERSSEEKPLIAGSAHRDVVKKILECCDDLVVEGFFREYGGGDNESGSGERVEACIFSSEKLRQLIVCYRGSTSNQMKPLKSSTFFGKEASSMLHEDQQVRVLSTFRDAYFSTTMEDTVFALLQNLATRKPFFDVVMTGHSFGAAMATIGAMRYAIQQPMIRVSCHVFGAPRVGGEEWRQMVHSVPNLKVFRAENACDPFIMLPSGSEWIHVGHAISFGDGVDSNSLEFKARQFDRDRSASSSSTMFRVPKVTLSANALLNLSREGKHDHEIKTYVDKLTGSGDKWFSEFSGFQGSGVNGDGNEKRTIA